MSSDFLQDLQRRGVTLWIDGERLRYRAPRGTLMPGDLEALRKHKTELMALIQRPRTLNRPPEWHANEVARRVIEERV